MTPWQVIEEALARRRPPRGQKWLADELGESIQTISNWKTRGVPARRFREIANALGLTLDQIEGIEPLPWDVAAGDSLPLSDDLRQKLLTLSDEALYRLETVMRAHLGMAQKAVAPSVRILRTGRAEEAADGRHGEDARQEEGSGLPTSIALPEPKKQHGRRQEDHRPSRKGGEGST